MQCICVRRRGLYLFDEPPSGRCKSLMKQIVRAGLKRVGKRAGHCGEYRLPVQQSCEGADQAVLHMGTPHLWRIRTLRRNVL